MINLKTVANDNTLYQEFIIYIPSLYILWTLDYIEVPLSLIIIQSVTVNYDHELA